MRAVPDLVITAVILTAALSTSAQDVFRFAGQTFDQRNTPNQAALLGNSATLGDARFSPGVATTTTPGMIPNFPENGTGYNGALGLGQLTGLGAGSRAVNLPSGNDGVRTRQGIEVWWTGFRGLPNLEGADLVIFEAGSSIAAVEGVMIRVHVARTSIFEPEEWTPWYYNPPTSFGLTLGAEGVFANVFDLSDLGVRAGGVIDRIQMGNLIQADRIAGPGERVGNALVGSGRVVFDGTSDVLPDAGSLDPDRLFDPTTFDPDPLYAAALHGVVALGPLFIGIQPQSNGVALDLEVSAGDWRIESADALPPDADWQLMETFTTPSAGVVHLLDVGQNTRPPPATVPTRYYRVLSQ